MRAIVLACLCSSLAAPVAWAQTWSGSLPTVVGQETTLDFVVPNLADLIYWNFFLAYSPTVFATPVIQNGVTYEFFDLNGPVSPPFAADFDVAVPAGHAELAASVLQPSTINVGPGPLFSVSFTAQSAGDASVYAQFNYALNNDEDDTFVSVPSLQTTVAVVPEPAKWAALLAGLGLIGCRIARRQA